MPTKLNEKYKSGDPQYNFFSWYFSRPDQELIDRVAKLLGCEDLDTASEEMYNLIQRVILSKSAREEVKIPREVYFVKVFDREDNMLNMTSFDNKNDAIQFKRKINNGNLKDYKNCYAKAVVKTIEEPISKYM